jgi:SAM-dependent methyltransferase
MSETSATQSLRCLACARVLPRQSSFEAFDRLHRTPGRFGVIVCRDCGSGITTPVVPEAELADYYPAGYGPYADPTNPFVAVISARIRGYQSQRALRTFPLQALRAGGPGCGVDIGCGRGDLAASLIAEGWRMTGVEPSPDAAENARARGVDVRVGTLSEVELEPEGYDAAVFQHSLEHTTDPLSDLTCVHTALRPDGVAAITVPNFSNWQARRLRSRWYHLDVPRHRVHFTREGLSALLERAGFELLELRTSTSAVGLPASMQYVVAKRCLFPDGLGLRVATGLCAVALPLAAIADRIGGGGDQLHALARRRS